MKWFQGSITEAVSASKVKKAIFVVFIQGQDDISKEIAQNLDSAEVSSKLESDKFVAIKLQSDTENYTFFVQIYQLVPVPSIFFIDENGAPLEVIGSPLTPTELSSKIDSILGKVYTRPSQSSSLIDNEQKAHSSTSQNVTQASNSPESSAYSQEEKILRAKKLIEMQNKKKMEEEERKEREREIQRRQTGKDVQKVHQQQQDKELKEAHEERLKEKAADAAARERILKQIAEDKLERKKKYEMYTKESMAQNKKAQDEAQARHQAESADMSKARIQFKLPAGNNIVGTFEPANTLGDLRIYVSQNAQLPNKHFSMSSFFPRRDFASADDGKTLLELDLVPSAVILILPLKSSNAASVIKSSDGSGIFSHFIWTLFAPVVSMYNYIVGYFTGRPRGDDGNQNQNRGSGRGGSSSTAFGGLANIGMRRLGGQGTTKIRARGNVHSLHSSDNDNDENNTWNGNSTQQM